MAAIEIAGVTKTFGSHVAVDDLSLSVTDGSIYGFIGPNGSGKTTTLRMIMNILLPDRGEIRVLGRSGSAAAHDDVGYLPEERGLYRKMRVGLLLHYSGALKGAKWGVGVGLGLSVFNIGFSDCSGEHCDAGDNVVGVAAFTDAAMRARQRC